MKGGEGADVYIRSEGGRREGREVERMMDALSELGRALLLWR